jgi:acetoin utilization protein AcuB
VRIEKLMKPALYTVKPHDTVAHARAILEEHRVNQLPVVVNRKLVGIVTDRDLRDAPAAVEVAAQSSGAMRNVPAPPAPGQISVEAVMTTNVLTLTPADSVAEAARLMRRERVGAIPVVDRGALVGIVARSDVLDAYVALSEERRKEQGSR